MPAGEFFVSTFMTALEPDELLAEVRVPGSRRATGSGFLELARRHGDFALAGVAALVTLDGDGAVADARIALIGVAATAVRCARPRRGGSRSPRHGRDVDADAAARREATRLDPATDIHASADVPPPHRRRARPRARSRRPSARRGRR